MVQKPSTQVTLDIGALAIRKLEAQIRKRFDDALQKRGLSIERNGEMGALGIIGAIAKGFGTVRVGSKSIGTIVARQSIRNSPLGTYLMSKKGIGELGIPDPQAALDTLVASIPDAVAVRVRIFKGKITISARFQPQKLLKSNPHPGRTFANGQNIGVDSWLQWATGPRKDGGTPGFGLARVGAIVSHLTSRGRESNTIDAIIQSSRTLTKAGGQAGLMLPINSIGVGKKSPYEALTGETGESWSPIPLGNNFWTEWWKANSQVMKNAFGKMTRILMEDVAAQMEK